MNTETLTSRCAPVPDLQVLQKQGVLPYTAVEEGELVVTRMAQVPDDIDTSRVTFVQVRLAAELHICSAGTRCGASRSRPFLAAMLQQAPAQPQHCLLQ